MSSIIAQSGLSTINAYVFGVISFILNSFLIYVIRKRPSRVIGTYKHMMVGCALFDICFSAVYVIASPTFAATPEMSALLIVNGGIDMPTIYGRVLLILFMLLFCQSLIIPPTLFVVRYLQICRKSTATQSFRWLRYMFVASILFASSVCGMICFSAWPTKVDLEYFTKIAYKINVNRDTTFLVATLNKSGEPFDRLQTALLLAGIICTIVIMITTMGVMTFCSTRIIHAAMNDTSVNSRRVQLQLCKVLFAQSVSPFLLLHLPFYVSILAPLFSARTGEASNYFPFLFAWCPVVNPLIALYFIRDFRKFIVCVFKKKTLVSTEFMR